MKGNVMVGATYQPFEILGWLKNSFGLLCNILMMNLLANTIHVLVFIRAMALNSTPSQLMLLERENERLKKANHQQKAKSENQRASLETHSEILISSSFMVEKTGELGSEV